MEFTHELILPNKDLPFKMFLFEGKDGNYIRDKHWHRSVEIFAVFTGGLEFFLNDESYPLQEGEFIIVNSNEIHSIQAPEKNHTVVLQIPLKLFEPYFTGEQYIRFTHKMQNQDEKVMQYIQEMFAAYEKKQCGYEMKAVGLFYLLMSVLVSEYRELEVSPDQLKRSQKLTRLSAIVNYVKENYQTDLSLEMLAKIFGYSPTYLSRMFQKYAGVNYKSYLSGLRTEYAYQELLNTNHSIGEIALNNGFPSSKAFAKAFADKYGMLPSEYRKKDKKTP